MRAFEDGIRSPNLKMITILEKAETLTASISFATMQEKRFGISPKFPNSQTVTSLPHSRTPYLYILSQKRASCGELSNSNGTK